MKFPLTDGINSILDHDCVTPKEKNQIAFLILLTEYYKWGGV